MMILLPKSTRKVARSKYTLALGTASSQLRITTLKNTAYAQPISALNAENGSVNASTGANTALNNMPTIAGQIFSGLQGLGNAAGNVMGGYGKMANG